MEGGKKNVPYHRVSLSAHIETSSVAPRLLGWAPSPDGRSIHSLLFSGFSDALLSLPGLSMVLWSGPRLVEQGIPRSTTL